MYTLPDDFNLSAFLNKDLESICFGKYTVDLLFSGNISVQMFMGYRHIRNNKILQDVEEFPITNSTLIELIGTSVTDIIAIQNRDLQITMSSGDIIYVLGTCDMYECYIISNGSIEAIV